MADSKHPLPEMAAFPSEPDVHRPPRPARQRHRLNLLPASAVRHRGHHADHLDAPAMTVSHQVGPWVSHRNAQDGHALVEHNLKRAGDEIGRQREPRGKRLLHDTGWYP